MLFRSMKTALVGGAILAGVGANASGLKAPFGDTQRVPAYGYAAFGSEWKFQPFAFTRHPVGANDVLIEIVYSGICHSDLHSVNGDWHPRDNTPMVPGHEIAGRVVQVGKNVSKFKVGDLAGVGCMVNSCGECEACKRSEEQFCQNGKTVFTYHSSDVFHNGELTYGGYSNNIVVSEKFAIKIPQNADLAKVAPLLCAGITTYSPIKFTNVKKGDKVAVAGFGGLGSLAVKYAVKLGAEVSVFDISEEKRELALKMGAKRFVNVNSASEFSTISNEFRVIIRTIPYEYDVNAYVKMLQLDGEMVILGLPANKDKIKIDGNNLAWNFRKKVYSSLIGGIKQTQEMVDYSVTNGIYPDVEIIPIQKLDEAYQNVAKGKVHFRYVIDMKSLG